MGQRSSTETVAALIGAFLEQRTWKQAELARRLDMTTGAVRKRLDEVAGWLHLEREEDHPHVFWSVPKDWFPGGLLIKRDEVPDLLRLVSRLPKSKARDRLLGTIIERIPHTSGLLPSVVAPAASPREEQHLAVIEDSARTCTPLRFRYFTASRGVEGQRHASIHRVFPGPPARFVATCHRTGGLKWFRIDNVTDASLDPREGYRLAADDTVVAFVAESLDGFREETAAVMLAFFVRDPEARWVARNLLSGMRAEDEHGGIRVTVRTTAVSLVARWVVQLGEAAKPETPVLAQKVVELAAGVLRRANEG